MSFSYEALSVLCREFSEEFSVVIQETKLFLTQFSTEKRVGFADAEAIKEAHLAPYAELVTSLLASLSRSDALALRLGTLLECTFCTAFAREMSTVEELFSAYERYRSVTASYLAESQKQLSDKAALSAKGAAPLIQSTRALLAAQMQAKESFSKHVSGYSVQLGGSI